MARTPIAGHATVSHTGYTTVYQSGATASTVIRNVTAYNGGAGAGTITLAITKANGDTVVLGLSGSLAQYATQSFGAESSIAVCPLTLLPGEVLKGQGSIAGFTVNASGLSFT